MAVQPSQAQYREDFDKYVSKATMLIHSPETTDKVIGMLSGQDPVQRVADATVLVMQRLDGAARQAGIEVQDSVKVFGAYEIVKLVIELGEAAKNLPKFSDDLTELALSVAVQDYVKSEVQAGRINPQQLQVAMQADLRKLPPAERKKIQEAQLRIQQTARKYNGGKGMMQQDEPEAVDNPQEEQAEPEMMGGMKKGLLGGMQ